MAGIALSASGRNMCRRHHLGVLRDVGAAMAGRTLTRQARVIHGGWRECDETIGMAAIALCRRRDVRRRFSQRIHCRKRSAMTGRTLRSSTPVAHPGRLEGGVVAMASVALGAGGDVRRRFAQRSAAVVTGGTDADG